MQRFDFDSVDSTNEAAKRLLAEGSISERAVVIAREQTAGKGTRGRSWASPKDAGLYFSVAETGWSRPRPPAAEYTLAAAVACVEVLAAVGGVEARLKPVNDLYAGGGKLGGILVETSIQNGVVTALVTGVGINLRRAELGLPPGAMPPVCLEELMPADAFSRLNLEALTAALAERIVVWNAVVAAGDVPHVRQAWDRHKLPGTLLPLNSPQRHRDTENST